MSNVKALPGVRPPNPVRNDELVSLLRNMLERAESGELQSFVGTGFCTDGMRLACWADTHTNVYEMLGALAWLQHEYVRRHAGGDQ